MTNSHTMQDKIEAPDWQKIPPEFSTDTPIVKWIRNYASSANMSTPSYSAARGLVVGVSGGIDSALVSTLCAMSRFPTYVVSLPIHQEMSQVNRANLHVKWLQEKYHNVHFIEIDLTKVYDSFEQTFSALNNREFQNELGFANTRARLRMTALYQIATAKNALVVGTGNKVEDFGVGFYTKYGDGGVDISPIGDMTKTEVREMAKSLGVIEEILLAKPTDGLWGDDRCDEDQLGASYPELEWAMEFVNTNPYYSPRDLEKLNSRELEVLGIYKKLHSKNLHKMVPIPVFPFSTNGKDQS